MDSKTTKPNIRSLLGEECIYTVHSSGLPVYFIPKDFSVNYALLGVRYGSLDNHFVFAGKEYRPPKGIAHFLEHKMFENPDGEDTFVKFSRTGADANAYTTFTRTAYLFSCSEHFEESLEILLKSCFTPYFTRENVKKEQGIIAEEIRMYEDDPFDTLYFSLMRCMYSEIELGVSICGTEESISEITPELLQNCYSAFYRPENMALCLCGNLNIDSVFPILDRILGTAPSPLPPPSVLRRSEGRQVVCPEMKIKADVALPLFAAGFKDTDISKDPVKRLRKYAAMAILFEALFGGSAEFAYQLYKDGDITGALDFEFDHNQNYSYLLLTGESPAPEKVKEKLYGYLAEIGAKGIDPIRLEGGRRIVYSQFLSTFDRTESIANEILTYVFEEQDMLSYGDLILDITDSECKALFDSIFKPEHAAFVSLYPESESEEST